MKKRLLTAVLLSGLISTASFANYGNNSCEYKGEYKKNHKQMKMKKFHQGGFMSYLYKLDLTSKQKEQIIEIRKEIRENRVSTSTAFSEKSFDKAKYIQLMKQKRENMIESKALMIEKVYEILNDKQKQELKAMMNKRMNFDKNCNGRR